MDDLERESVPAIQILLVSFNRSNDTNECAGTTASMFSPTVNLQQTFCWHNLHFIGCKKLVKNLFRWSPHGVSSHAGGSRSPLATLRT